MKFEMQVEMDNAAFTDAPATELARILRKVAAKVEEGYEKSPCVDVNGNSVGQFSVTD